MVFEKGMRNSQNSTMINNEMVDGKFNVPSNFSVLVVDDDNVVRQIHKMLMSTLGFQVQAVKNGKEAVDIHRAGASFNLILMDMEMPVMNGIEATRVLRAMGVSSNIVGVTTCTAESDRNAFMAAGANACAAKPLNVNKIASFLP